MENRIKFKTLLFMVLIISNVVSCQDKKNEICTTTGFCIQDTLLYYNQKHIALGMPINKFEEAMGKYDRILVDEGDGGIHVEWIWKKKLIKVTKGIDRETGKKIFWLEKMNHNQVTGELEIDNHKELMKYESFDKIVKKYGKNDSIYNKKKSIDKVEFYVWDNLGVTLRVEENKAIQIDVYTAPLKITRNENFNEYKKNKDDIKMSGPIYELKREEKRLKFVIDSYPKQIYTGNFSYEKNTISFKDWKILTWKTAIKTLDIEGSNFDPPGDSDEWSRYIKEGYELFVDINRYKDQQNDIIGEITLFNKSDAK